MQYWLVKSEPATFSILDLERVREEPWTGVRGFAARNFMMEMRVGDAVLFYHSSCAVPGVYGLAKVSKKAEPDKTQFDIKSDYFDARSKNGSPLWWCVIVSFLKSFSDPVTLEEIKRDSKLRGMKILKEARLSVSPVTKSEYEHILTLANDAKGLFGTMGV